MWESSDRWRTMFQMRNCMGFCSLGNTCAIRCMSTWFRLYPPRASAKRRDADTFVGRILHRSEQQRLCSVVLHSVWWEVLPLGAGDEGYLAHYAQAPGRHAGGLGWWSAYIMDSVTGELWSAYIFVAELPCIWYTYAEACGDIKQKIWLLCYVHAFDYFGNVSRLMILDNVKTATISNNRYEVVRTADRRNWWSITTQWLSRHVCTSPMTGLRWRALWNAIMAALRDREFFAIEGAQRATIEKLEISWTFMPFDFFL